MENNTPPVQTLHATSQPVQSQVPINQNHVSQRDLLVEVIRMQQHMLTEVKGIRRAYHYDMLMKRGVTLILIIISLFGLWKMATFIQGVMSSGVLSRIGNMSSQLESVGNISDSLGDLQKNLPFELPAGIESQLESQTNTSSNPFESSSDSTSEEGTEPKEKPKDINSLLQMLQSQ